MEGSHELRQIYERSIRLMNDPSFELGASRGLRKAYNEFHETLHDLAKRYLDGDIDTEQFLENMQTRLEPLCEECRWYKQIILDTG